MAQKFDISIKYFDTAFLCSATATYQDCTKFPDEESLRDWESSLGRIDKVTITFKH